jgi:thymidylate synthase ThyX
MSFKDSGHRPHAVHTGEEPRNPILKGPEGITVTLDTWGPRHNLFPTLYDMLQSNWGDAPSRTSDRYCDMMIAPENDEPTEVLRHMTGECKLSTEEMAYVESLFAGRTLPQAKELITFAFTVDGVSRTCTHQLVRTRIGAAFMQHGGRDNDWRHRPWRMPETIRRACEHFEDDPPDDGKAHCIIDWQPILDETSISSDNGGPSTLEALIEDYLSYGRHIYAALVDAGIPWQDARFLLPDGMTTYIHGVYNYAALEGMLTKRLEHIMQWEINCVAQLMVREIKMKCPELLSKYLMSLSDKQQRDAFSGLESWTPVGKYPMRSGHDLDLPRTHRPEQNPFWVLHPDSMAGGPVQWIPTNGTYPKEF